MKHANRTNTLLIELMIVLFFFMLASMILVQIFATSRDSSRNAAYRTEALTEVQNMAESVYAGIPVENVLLSGGFSLVEDGVWAVEKEGFILTAVYTIEATEAGALHSCEFSAIRDEEVLFSLPCTRYLTEGGGAE